jgi:gas vesicle protein
MDVDLARFLALLNYSQKNIAMGKNNRYNQSGRIGLVLGIFVSATAGALAGMLYTSKSGGETRDELKNMADQQLGGIKKRWQQLRKKVTGGALLAQRKVEAARYEIPSGIDVYAENTRDTTDQLRRLPTAPETTLQNRY